MPEPFPPARPARNAFHRTLLGLDHGDADPDLFSRACVETFDEHDPQSYGYVFAQVFEPGVLAEVARLEGVPHEVAESLEHCPTPRMRSLRERLDRIPELRTVELVNLAAALISVSRFRPATRVLRRARSVAHGARERFEVAMLDFVVANRTDDVAGTRGAFARMRADAETGKVSPPRVLDAASQAVVWRLKQAEAVDADDARWFLLQGRALIARSAVDPAAASAWHRAAAMLPAKRGDRATTRRYMRAADEAADASFALRSRAYERHLKKTYHESSLKEHMYLTRDLARAVAAGEELIALDPHWSVSHGELAEAYTVFGHQERAAACYERAVALGPPYLGHHLLAGARAHHQAGDGARAAQLADRLDDLAPGHAAARDLREQLGAA